jgi:hypothetical protein
MRKSQGVCISGPVARRDGQGIEAGKSPRTARKCPWWRRQCGPESVRVDTVSCAALHASHKMHVTSESTFYRARSARARYRAESASPAADSLGRNI